MFDLTIIAPFLRKPSCIALSIYLVLYTKYLLQRVYVCMCVQEKEDFERERARLKEEIARDKAERKARGGKLSTKLGVDGYNPSAPQGTYGGASGAQSQGRGEATQGAVQGDGAAKVQYIAVHLRRVRAGGRATCFVLPVRADQNFRLGIIEGGEGTFRDFHKRDIYIYIYWSGGNGYRKKARRLGCFFCAHFSGV